jgi:hypothetical protein
MVLPSIEIDWWLSHVSQLSTELCFVKSKELRSKEEGEVSKKADLKRVPRGFELLEHYQLWSFKSGDKNESSIDLIDLK